MDGGNKEKREKRKYVEESVRGHKEREKNEKEREGVGKEMIEGKREKEGE